MREFDHEMLREIYEQPEAIGRTLALYTEGAKLNAAFAIPLAEWNSAHGEVLIAASGSSRHSGLAAEILLEDLCGLSVDVEYASEYSCRTGENPRHPSVIVLSQSGETSDTLAALREARHRGQKTLAITNVEESTMAREADLSMPLGAGKEKAIPATKKFYLPADCTYTSRLLRGSRERSLERGGHSRRNRGTADPPGQHRKAIARVGKNDGGAREEI